MMRTVLTIVLLCVFSQARTHELSADRQLLELLRPKVVSKKELVPIQTTDLNTETPPTEDYGWIKEEFVGIEEALLFPGSNFIVELIRLHCESSDALDQMDIEDIKETFELPECQLIDIGKNAFKVLKLIKDPESVALLATRRVLGPIFHERIRCPATILDISIVRAIMATKDEYMKAEDDSFYSFFKTMAPLVHPVLAPHADDLATIGVALLHGTVFNETIDFFFAYGMIDVALASHKVFAHLRDFFQHTASDTPSNRDSRFMHHIHKSTEQVKCANAEQLTKDHQKIVWRFLDEFGGIETERICTTVVLFLTKYVNKTIPNTIVDFEENGNLQIVCEKVREHINELVAKVGQYESFLYSMNIRELEDLLRKMMTNAEWVILKEAVKQLGFTEIR